MKMVSLFLAGALLAMALSGCKQLSEHGKLKQGEAFMMIDELSNTFLVYSMHRTTVERTSFKLETIVECPMTQWETEKAISVFPSQVFFPIYPTRQLWGRVWGAEYDCGSDSSKQLLRIRQLGNAEIVISNQVLQKFVATRLGQGSIDLNLIIEDVFYVKGIFQDLLLIRATNTYSDTFVLINLSGRIVWFDFGSKQYACEFGEFDKLREQYGLTIDFREGNMQRIQPSILSLW